MFPGLTTQRSPASPPSPTTPLPFIPSPPAVFESLKEYSNSFKALLELERDYDMEQAAKITPPLTFKWSTQKKLNSSYYDLIGTFALPIAQREQYTMRRGVQIFLKHPQLGDKDEITGTITATHYRTDNIEVTLDSKVVTSGMIEKLSHFTPNEYVMGFVFDNSVYERMFSVLGTWQASPALTAAFFGQPASSLTPAQLKKSAFLDAKYVPTFDQIKYGGARPLTDRQTEAILLSLTNPVVSVQGPFGTGKSSVISMLAWNLRKAIKRQYEDKLTQYNLTLDLIDPYDLDAFSNHVMDPQVEPPVKPSPILVCAPSNVASDHLARLLTEIGLDVVRVSSKRYRQIKYETDDDVENSSLHRRMQAWLLLNPNSELAQLHYDLFSGVDEGNTSNIFAKLGDLINDDQIGEEVDPHSFHQFVQKLRLLFKQGSKFVPDEQAITRWTRLYRSLQQEILNNTDVVCTTFANAGNAVLFSDSTFNHVILDEVSQSTEPQLLLPLTYDAKHLVLFGDQKQLGPIVNHEGAAAAGLARSLFVRLLETQTCPTIMLDTQFRMHPCLSHFSSITFYDGLLKNGVNGADRNDFHDRFPWPNPDNPICFVNTVEGYEEKLGHSFWNPYDIAVLENILICLVTNGFKLADIGLVIPYVSQARKLLAQLCDHSRPFIQLIHDRCFVRPGKRAYGDNFISRTTFEDVEKFIEERLELDSVESYQGREKKIIIFNTVRAQGHTIGFLKDPRRINVGLTRAQHGMIVVGSSKTLSKNQHWSQFVQLVDTTYNAVIPSGTELLKRLKAFQTQRVTKPTSHNTHNGISNNSTNHKPQLDVHSTSYKPKFPGSKSNPE